MTKAITTIGRAENVLIEWLKECDADSFCSVFDYAFGVKSEYDEESQKFIVEPGAENEYGGIIEEEFKEEIVR